MDTNRKDRFSTEYSKALAEALRENELKGDERTKSQLILETYTALCYDDPHVNSEKGCWQLATCLSTRGDQLALSERFVEGIRQVTARNCQKGVKSDSISQDIQEGVGTLREEPEGVATAVGYAALAMTAFLQIPLYCCQSREKSDVEILLGSYRGPGVVDISDRYHHENDGQATNDEVNDTITGYTIDNDTYKEVWAEQSDPSDFDFGPNDQYTNIDWAAWEDTSFDPEKLSKPKEGTWNELGLAVQSLLRELTYSKLSPLGTMKWRSLRVSDHLSQLTLALLIEETNPMLDALRVSYIHPLNTFRDRVYEFPDECLTNFLNLVQSLLAVDATQEPQDRLAPASIVGISSLSALCEDAAHLKKGGKIRQAALEACEDLASLIERSQKIHEGDDPVWLRLLWSILPVLDIIASLSPNGIAVDATSSFTSKDAQWLLTSGLFRALIMLYTRTQDSSPAAATARHCLLQSLEVLSLQNLSIIAKYAYRVPELSRIVHSPDFHARNPSNAIIWSLLGVEFAGKNSVRLANAPVITKGGCEEMALKSIEKLVGKVTDAMGRISRLRSAAKEREALEEELQPIHELTRLTNLLSSSKTFSSLWNKVLSKGRLESLLGMLRGSLDKVPAAVQVRVEAVQKDSEEKESKARQQKADHDDEISATRKSLKILSLSTQQDGGQSISSKTD